MCNCQHGNCVCRNVGFGIGDVEFFVALSTCCSNMRIGDIKGIKYALLRQAMGTKFLLSLQKLLKGVRKINNWHCL
jgi:hypothetical protein